MLLRSADYRYTWEVVTYNYPRLGVAGFSINPHTGEVLISGNAGTRILPPPYTSSTPLYDKSFSMPSCFDRLKNGDETSVDAGGVCSENKNKSKVH